MIWIKHGTAMASEIWQQFILKPSILEKKWLTFSHPQQCGQCQATRRAGGGRNCHCTCSG